MVPDHTKHHNCFWNRGVPRNPANVWDGELWNQCYCNIQFVPNKETFTDEILNRKLPFFVQWKLSAKLSCFRGLWLRLYRENYIWCNILSRDFYILWCFNHQYSFWNRSGFFCNQKLWTPAAFSKKNSKNLLSGSILDKCFVLYSSFLKKKFQSRLEYNI